MAKFSEVLTIINGKNQSKVENPYGKYPIYGSGGIMGYADDYICEPHTVIIGRKGSINKPIFVETPFWNVDTAFGLSANKDVLLPKYLYYFCEHFDFEKLNTTVTIPSLTKANLLNIEIELPTIEQQREIVFQLDNVESIVSLRKQQLSKLDELVKSRFVELFGDPITSKNKKKLSEIGRVFTGNTPSMKEPSYYESNDIPFIKPSDLTESGVTSIDRVEAFISEKARPVARIIPPQAVLVTCIGTIGKIGITARESCCNQQINFVAPNDGINSVYLAHCLTFFKSTLQNIANAPVVPIINKTQFSELEVPVVDMDKQNQFAAFVEQTDKSKLAIQQSLEKLETLKKALMQKYFG